MPEAWPSVPGMSSGGGTQGQAAFPGLFGEVQLRCNLTRVSSGFQVT